MMITLAITFEMVGKILLAWFCVALIGGLFLGAMIKALNPDLLDRANKADGDNDDETPLGVGV